MTLNHKLHQYIENALKVDADKIYLKTTDSAYSFKQVYEIALAFENKLMEAGIKKNDRVVLYSSKNVACVAMMIACSRCECIYVPISSLNPGKRALYIIEETNARFILCDAASELELKHTSLSLNALLKDSEITLFSNSATKIVSYNSNDAAFILFTSGSTGTPKGVVFSHAAAITFIDWAAEEFEISNSDILASIAPFNFDLSVFDIYVTAKKKATLVIYTESQTKNALLMAQQISYDKITTIYATPTFFSTLAHYGKLHKFEYLNLKNILFAGEVFQLDNFKLLLTHWPDLKYANLYGPTETNVCTFYNINSNQMDYTTFPIGKNCSYAKLLILDESNNEIHEANKYGELLVAGESLFNEYWKDPQKTIASMFKSQNEISYYRTGDIVYKNEKNDLVYVSRNDRMIKKNGFRIEPSEIESAISSYPKVSNAAVLFSKFKNQIVCFVEYPEPMADNFNAMKLFCQNSLPGYMVPDKFVILETLPKTSSGKIDLQALDNQL